MCTGTGPASMAQALAMLKSAMRFLADLDKAGLPAEVLGDLLQAMERVDAIGAAIRGEAMAAFDAQDGSVADGQRTTRTWIVHNTRVTRGQAAEHIAVQMLAEAHRPLHCLSRRHQPDH